MTREEVYKYLVQLEPLEYVLKRIYEKHIDWKTMSRSQMKGLFQQYINAAKTYPVNKKLHCINSLDELMAHENYSIFTEENFQRLYEKIGSQSDMYMPKPDWSHLTVSQYFQQQDKNMTILKHTRYSKSDMHDHEFIEMVYMFTGTSQHVFLTNGKREEMMLVKGDVLLIPPGMSHEVYVYDESLMINVLINKDTFQEAFLGDLPKGNILFEFFCNIILLRSDFSYLIFHSRENLEVRNALLDLIISYVEKDEVSGKICDHYLSILFLNLLRSCKEEDIEVSQSARKAVNQIIPMMSYIRKNYRKISLEKVAKEFHYSEAYVNRIFKKYTGNTVLKYIQNLRFQEARKLLEETDMSVEEICNGIGYQDTSYFIGQFKRIYNVTPHQFRLANHN